MIAHLIAASALTSHLLPTQLPEDWAAALAPPHSAELDCEGATYVSDHVLWNGAGNVVTRPGVLIERGGDCEEFAICLYHRARALGASPDEVFVAVGRVPGLGGLGYLTDVHAVFARWTGDGVLYQDIVPLTDGTVGLLRLGTGYFEPWYFINENGAWRVPVSTRDRGDG